MMNPYDSGYLIQPGHIDTSSKLAGEFHIVAQHIARNIVCLSQKDKKWVPFERSDIRALGKDCSESDKLIDYMLGDLELQGFLVKKHGKFFITHAFAVSCFKTSPFSDNGRNEAPEP